MVLRSAVRREIEMADLESRRSERIAELQVPLILPLPSCAVLSFSPLLLSSSVLDLFSLLLACCCLRPPLNSTICRHLHSSRILSICCPTLISSSSSSSTLYIFFSCRCMHTLVVLPPLSSSPPLRCSSSPLCCSCYSCCTLLDTRVVLLVS